MTDKNKKYENRYWLVNDDVFELHFTQFYDDKVILKFVQDKDDSENYIYVSDLLNVEHDEIQADSVEDAMEQFEDMVIEHIIPFFLIILSYSRHNFPIGITVSHLFCVVP